ncbi:phosphoethanolamine transferase domain-containing protein [Coprobacter fastidiosus]|uniref:phosphoethanolamine transferase domain-containing protein n=2 Tax=Coprobacter TaxID=1348911 RepID=UPI00349EEF0C
MGLLFVCPVSFWVFVSMNKYLFAFLFPLFGIVYAVFACFRYAYKFVLNSMMLYTAFNNDVRITAELISPYLVLFVLINLFISFLFVRYLWKMKIYRKSCLFSFNAFCAFSLFFLMFQGNSPMKRMNDREAYSGQSCFYYSRLL